MGNSKREWGKAQSFEELASLRVSYFKDFSRAPTEASIAEVIRVAQFFRSFIYEEGNDLLMSPVSKDEVEVILKSMQKEKSLGPDGWTVEFILQFFDAIGEDLMRWWKNPGSQVFSTSPSMLPS